MFIEKEIKMKYYFYLMKFHKLFLNLRISQDYTWQYMSRLNLKCIDLIYLFAFLTVCFVHMCVCTASESAAELAFLRLILSNRGNNHIKGLKPSFIFNCCK